MNYKSKYLKYKLKYLKAKQLYGGSHSSDELNELFEKKTNLNEMVAPKATADLNPSGIAIRFVDSPEFNNPLDNSPTISGQSSSTMDTARKDVLEELQMYSRQGEESDKNVLGVEIGNEIGQHIPKFWKEQPIESKHIARPRPKPKEEKKKPKVKKVELDVKKNKNKKIDPRYIKK